MSYTIGEISKITGISVPTLRYYDKEGLFHHMERTDGNIRMFSETELLTIKWISCLKSTGMTLKQIKGYLDMNTVGDTTLEVRLELFNEREQAVLDQMKELEKTMAMVQIKKWWYTTSLELGSEDLESKIKQKDYPEDIYKQFKLAFGDDFEKGSDY